MDMFRLQLRDNVKAREQQPAGSYTYVLHETPAVNAQEELYLEAYQAAGNVVSEQGAGAPAAEETEV